MDVPASDIEHCRGAHERLRELVAPVTDETARRPSLLPGWTVGHLLTHIARNADGVLRRLDGARRGEVADQYVGGVGGRAREIEAGAHRSATELIADVVETAAAVDAAFASFPADYWDRLGRGVRGEEQPVGRLPFQRWREVEVHMADLGLGYSPAAWPEELADRWLPEVLAGLTARTDARQLLAWTLRRGDAPELAPY